MSVKYRYIGVTDECIECQQCGRPDLKCTIVLAILDADGNEEEITYFGSSCAAKALGIKATGGQVKKSALWAHEQTMRAAKEARDVLGYYEIPAEGDVTPRMLRHAASRYHLAHIGAAWADSVTPAGWRDMVEDMIVRKRAAIREAALIGA